MSSIVAPNKLMLPSILFALNCILFSEDLFLFDFFTNEVSMEGVFLSKVSSEIFSFNCFLLIHFFWEQKRSRNQLK